MQNNQTKQFTLENIAGYEDEKQEAIKIINLFKKYDTLKNFGVEIPKGLILSGVPGVGKTLMAKVIASEAGVPLFEYEASEDESPEGSINNLKALFAKARECAPSIVFIDELDEIISRMDYISDYTRAVMKILLTELDGIKTSDGVLTICTTNNYERIPYALLRSGRMDKSIMFSLPNLDTREAILRLYSKDKPLLSNINIRQIAVRTSGFNCADLKTLINETLLQTVVTDKNKITNADFYRIIPTIVFKGIKKKNRQAPIDQLCYHELGHFICEYVLKGDIPEISIERIGNVDGHIRSYYEDDKYHSSNDLKNLSIIALAGYASEKVFFNETYSGASRDISQFNELFDIMSSNGMLGSKVLYSGTGMPHYGMRGRERTTGESNRLASWFDECVSEATKIIEDNKDLLKFMAEKLKKEEMLTPEQTEKLIEEFKKQ